MGNLGGFKLSGSVSAADETQVVQHKRASGDDAAAVSTTMTREPRWSKLLKDHRMVIGD
jgi:hypothetical protein